MTPNQNSDLPAFAFFVWNADFDRFNEALDEIDFPTGERYRMEKFQKMKDNTKWFMSDLSNVYLTKLGQWCVDNIDTEKRLWKNNSNNG